MREDAKNNQQVNNHPTHKRFAATQLAADYVRANSRLGLRYLTSLLPQIAIGIAFIAVFGYLLRGYTPELAGFFLICSLVTALGIVIISYYRRRKFIRLLILAAKTYCKHQEALIEQGSVLNAVDPLLMGSLLATMQEQMRAQPTDGFDTELFGTFLELVSQERKDQITQLYQQKKDYQQYLELWVHEIKTPLAAMQARLSQTNGILRDELAYQSDQIASLVDQALYYARLESFNKDFLITRFSLLEAVQTAIRNNMRLLIAHRMHVELEQEQLSQTVLADKKWLVFVLEQLIINAVKYQKMQEEPETLPMQEQEQTCASCSKGRIHLTARSVTGDFQAPLVELIVTDFGMGISPADLPRVCDRGFTGTNEKNHINSTGMGLYLAKTICEEMQLSLSVSSELGNYTRVTICFPM